VLSFLRRGTGSGEELVFVFNFTPVPRQEYRIGVPRAGAWRELLNSDAGEYGGSGVGNAGRVESEPVPEHGRADSVVLTIPPLGALVLKHEPPPILVTKTGKADDGKKRVRGRKARG
jgi:1,4-alpha-glucan branching enzyme